MRKSNWSNIWDNIFNQSKHRGLNILVNNHFSPLCRVSIVPQRVFSLYRIRELVEETKNHNGQAWTTPFWFATTTSWFCTTSSIQRWTTTTIVHPASSRARYALICVLSFFLHRKWMMIPILWIHIFLKDLSSGISSFKFSMKQIVFEIQYWILSIFSNDWEWNDNSRSRGILIYANFVLVRCYFCTTTGFRSGHSDNDLSSLPSQHFDESHKRHEHQDPFVCSSALPHRVCKKKKTNKQTSWTDKRVGLFFLGREPKEWEFIN